MDSRHGSVRHLVLDGFGLVGCPWQGDVALDSCLVCSRLVGATRNADGAVDEVSCASARGEAAPREGPGPSD